METLNRRAVSVVCEILSLVRLESNGSFVHVFDKNFKQAFLIAVSLLHFHSSFLRIYQFKYFLDRFEFAYDDFVLDREYFDINNNQNAESEYEQASEQEEIITIEYEIKEEDADDAGVNKELRKSR